MKPYYQDSHCTIYHGDARIILPQLDDCDLLLTDPPYGIDENSKKQKSCGKLASPTNYGDFDWDKSPPETWMIQLMIAKSKHQIMWGGNYFGLPASSCWLVWDKENGDNDFADCELAWTSLPKAVRKIRYRWAGMLQENMANKEPRLHPTQKPLPVITWAIRQAPPEIKTIIDPYGGSFTTLRAAKDLGIHAIGIDRTEQYCEIGAKRLQQECLPLATQAQPEVTHRELFEQMEAGK